MYEPACKFSLVYHPTVIFDDVNAMKEVEIPADGGVTVIEYTMSVAVQTAELSVNAVMFCSAKADPTVYDWALGAVVTDIIIISGEIGQS